MKPICDRCGKPATGYAGIWTKALGNRRYCHGDNDPSPTCYELAQAAQWHDPTVLPWSDRGDVLHPEEKP